MKARRAMAMACAIACAVACNATLADPISADLFAREPLVEDAQLSPDGTHVALTMQALETQNLALLDIATGKTTMLTALKRPSVVFEFAWKSDRYLIFQAGTAEGEPVVMVIDLQTHKQFRINGPWEWTWFTDLRWSDPTRMLLTFNGEPDRYLMEIELRDATPGYHVNPRPAAQERQAQFILDSTSAARAALTWEPDGTRKLLYRAQSNARWLELMRSNPDEESIRPLAFTEDDRQLYVLSNVGRDTLALYRYDPEARKLGELLFEADGVDITDGVYGPGQTHLIAVRYDAQGKGVHYVDSRAQQIHLAALKAFPNMQSEIVSLDAQLSRAIVRVRSPQTPGTLYLYDRASNSLRTLMDVAPWLDAAQMASVRPFTAKARDGLALHGYLMLPHGVAAHDLPLVVTLTGSADGTRHRADFDPLAQFLASRGYAILQLDPRGSSGYGREFRRAGFQNWHSVVQTDLLDAIESLVHDGIADRTRVGLFGTDFGGYVALLALLRSPESYKCAVIYGGFGDPQAMVGMSRVWVSAHVYRELDPSERRRMEALLGSGGDAAMAEQRALLGKLGSIRVPVFIAHGRADAMVPFRQATALVDALSADPGRVSAFFPTAEDHEFSRPENRATLYRSLEQFLARSFK